MKKHTNTFTATSDDGKIYTINEYTDYHNAGSFENPDQNVEGFKELRTSDGNTVNRIKKGKYKIFGPFGEIILTSDDPKAP